MSDVFVVNYEWKIDNFYVFYLQDNRNIKFSDLFEIPNIKLGSFSLFYNPNSNGCDAFGVSLQEQHDINKGVHVEIMFWVKNDAGDKFNHWLCTFLEQ